ncbi:MAG: TauD/TfdA family dioxygenase [Candidatus Latescibacteria bacterium]|nr:TauD/TfdA family dioxygenase [Candidatus Latescibacterota bacterium]
MTDLSATSSTGLIQVIPGGGALGATVENIDLSQALSQAVVDQVHQALLDHCVLVFPGQNLSDQDQVRFTGYFGRPVEHVRRQPDRPVKEIFLISNIEQQGQAIGALGHGEISFHSDLSYMRQPGTLSLLYAIELPQSGGATHWCNGYAAYEALDDAMKARLKGLRAVHRHYVEEQNPPEEVDHPIVRTHPETGRRALYVGPHLTKYVVDMEPEQSQALLQQLFAHMIQPRFVWAHHWRVGDLVMWDNRPTMHRRDPFPPQERRLLKRTQIFNDEIPVE